MKQVHFIIGIHNHQPIGNFNEVFINATERAYAPWIKTMVSHPEIKWNLHMSGILWDWMKDNNPSFLQSVEDLLKNGSLELLTGGYYEPILPVLPEHDARGQIKKLTSYLENEFSCSPKGLWLPERVWEPHLPRMLVDAGIEYTVLDDRHFLQAGLSEQELNGYFMTEDRSKTVALFPGSQKLRYMVPFAPPEETIEYLRSKTVEGGDSVVIMADDGEKFGLWPGTFEFVYTFGWLERFIALLNENREWIITSTFSDIIRKFAPRSTIYIPCATYAEMSQWALPYLSGRAFSEAEETVKKLNVYEAVRPFLNGGFWRNFLVRYPESNDMYQKMLFVSRDLKLLEDNNPDFDRRQLAKARDALWAGQCNCAYWHGVFGGIYLPHLRNAVYENLIAAQNLLDGEKGYRHEAFDFRKTGKQEVLITGTDQNLYFAPASGGSLFEWDMKRFNLNIAHVVARRPELYHRILKDGSAGQGASEATSIHDMLACKEHNLQEYLYYDWYRRSCFIDHFFHPKTTREGVYAVQYGEQGDFVLSEYKWKIAETEQGFIMSMLREGKVWVDDVQHPVVVQKKFILRSATGIEVVYTIRNVGNAEIPLWFACEMNISLSEKTARDEFSGDQITLWERDDRWLGFRMHIESKKPCGLWSFPVETVSSAENGFERTYQGTSIILHWQVSCKPGESIELPITVAVHERQKDYISGEEISRFINR